MSRIDQTDKATTKMPPSSEKKSTPRVEESPTLFNSVKSIFKRQAEEVFSFFVSKEETELTEEAKQVSSSNPRADLKTSLIQRFNLKSVEDLLLEQKNPKSYLNNLPHEIFNNIISHKIKAETTPGLVAGEAETPDEFCTFLSDSGNSLEKQYLAIDKMYTSLDEEGRRIFNTEFLDNPEKEGIELTPEDKKKALLYLSRSFDVLPTEIKPEMMEQYKEDFKKFESKINNGSTKGLYMSRERIKYIPRIIEKCKELIFLDLNTNRISIIPREIGRLKELKELNLSQNGISIVPKEVGQLKKLKTLGLAKNKMIAFPKEVELIASLENLNIGDNKIETVSKGIGQLKKLEYLVLSKNPIETLPEEIGQLKKLKELHLQKSPISGTEKLKLQNKFGEIVKF